MNGHRPVQSTLYCTTFGGMLKFDVYYATTYDKVIDTILFTVELLVGKVEISFIMLTMLLNWNGTQDQIINILNTF